ncbi:1-acyl-sn-glycerol-3-phosphate acyltransferase [Mycobacterium sp. M1]|uniref:1-acyl-sn-glycerol-3-phosphate acyltransferase n=1 Tax=Mycolicibacter acidiphilus TaxID=2835306 RepID=A0ABS5RLL3_9MYCO|nr:1-acyl-sn-glycerol-3-phosphate acyltransferase [Mycolicibacter acidiphilus]MBS9535202.1 1-acyl-sn-glycerol-3-phosphate acyltransferase [Mycolicibacter acidiphilus]
MEPWFGTVAVVARTLWRFQGVKITITGAENLPATGGAVIAINHTGYLDFAFAGLPAYLERPRRRVRFMAKKETFDNRYTGPIMRGCRHIAVDRAHGHASYEEAVAKLKAGELVGVYPEATISRSFELKEFKGGAARMAIEAQVPIIPHIVWGAQRIWTKDYPKRLGRTKIPVSVTIGEPILPDLPMEELRALMRTRMQELLERAQNEYGSAPAGEFWVPKRLGGGAPSPAEALELDAAEAKRKAAERAAREQQGQG